MSTALATVDTVRECRTCGIGKRYDEYYTDKRYPNGDIHCAECRREKVKRWRDANPDRAKEIGKASRGRNPEAARVRARNWYATNKPRALTRAAKRRREFPDVIKSEKLKASFGITIERYNEILTSQSHKCAICGMSQIENGKALAVDHCHSTGAVRGLLCSRCNYGLGMFLDSVNTLSSAISYLHKHTK